MLKIAKEKIKDFKLVFNEVRKDEFRQIERK